MLFRLVGLLRWSGGGGAAFAETFIYVVVVVLGAAGRAGLPGRGVREMLHVK